MTSVLQLCFCLGSSDPGSPKVTLTQRPKQVPYTLGLWFSLSTTKSGVEMIRDPLTVTVVLTSTLCPWSLMTFQLCCPISKVESSFQAPLLLQEAFLTAWELRLRCSSIGLCWGRWAPLLVQTDWELRLQMHSCVVHTFVCLSVLPVHMV